MADQNHIFEGGILNDGNLGPVKHGPGIIYGIFPVYFFVEFNRDLFHGEYQSLRICLGDFRMGNYEYRSRSGEQKILTLNGLFFGVLCDPSHFSHVFGKFEFGRLGLIFRI